MTEPVTYGQLAAGVAAATVTVTSIPVEAAPILGIPVDVLLAACAGALFGLAYTKPETWERIMKLPDERPSRVNQMQRIVSGGKVAFNKVRFAYPQSKVFVLDGVLMGAGDGPYLAWAMLITLVVFTPFALLVPVFGGGLTALWGTMTLMMTVRLLTLWFRTRSGRWVVTGVTR